MPKKEKDGRTDEDLVGGVEKRDKRENQIKKSGKNYT